MLRAGQSHYKVGVTSNIKKRISALQTSNANKVELVTLRFVDDHRQHEKTLHNWLRQFRTNGGKEWFKVSPDQAVDIAIRINQLPEVELADRIIGDIKNQVVFILNNYADQRAKIELAKPVKLEPALEELKPNQKEIQFESDLLTALDIFKKKGKASTSMLQVNMNVGFGRASRIVNELENRGFIGPSMGASFREVRL